MFYHVFLKAVLLLVSCIDFLFKPGLMAAITALSPWYDPDIETNTCFYSFSRCYYPKWGTSQVNINHTMSILWYKLQEAIAENDFSFFFINSNYSMFKQSSK